eukprot:2029542-Prymnesium_polylepis.1
MIPTPVPLGADVRADRVRRVLAGARVQRAIRRCETQLFCGEGQACTSAVAVRGRMRTQSGAFPCKQETGCPARPARGPDRRGARGRGGDTPAPSCSRRSRAAG